MQRDRTPEKMVVKRQQHFRQAQRQGQCQQRRQQRLAQKLENDLRPARACAFAQSDLARPKQRARRGQIGEIETGDQQDQRPDNTQP